jgi:hypothetical protein
MHGSLLARDDALGRKKKINKKEKREKSKEHQQKKKNPAGRAGAPCIGHVTQKAALIERSFLFFFLPFLFRRCCCLWRFIENPVVISIDSATHTKTAYNILKLACLSLSLLSL